MNSISHDELRNKLGLVLTRQDASLGLSCYEIEGASNLRLMVSISEVENSFQIVLFLENEELALFSSEMVSDLKIEVSDVFTGLRVKFEYGGATSEAVVQTSPVIKCRWSVLET